MKKLLTATAIVSSLILTGCGTAGLPGLRPLTYAAPGEARVYVSGNRCPHNPAGQESATIAAAFATSAASQLLTNFQTTLAKAAEGGKLPSSVATANFEVEPGTLPQCIIIVRGELAGAGKAAINLKAQVAQGEYAAQIEKEIDEMHFPAYDRIDHYVELKVLAAQSGKAITYAPVYIWFPKSMGGASSGTRDLSVALTFKAGDDSQVGSPVLLAGQKIGSKTLYEAEVRTGRYIYEAPWFKSFSTKSAVIPSGAAAAAAPAVATVPAQPAPSAPNPIGTAVSGDGSHPAPSAAPDASGRSQVVNIKYAGPNGIPASVTATVVETRPERAGLGFVASVFATAQPTIKGKLDEALDPSVAATHDQTAMTAESTAQTSYAAALTSMLTYCEGSSLATDYTGRSDRIQKSSAAQAAQVKANVDASKANADGPFATLVQISGAVVVSSPNVTVCASVHN